ncbi:MAG: molybdopterin-guanine dinucleotide biosynthesis protein MobB [Bilophila sp.]
MQAIGIIGFSNSGKTTLISRLSECLEARGLKVAIAKHTHHELDKPDTDTALLMSPRRTVIGLSNTKDGKGEAMMHWGIPVSCGIWSPCWTRIFCSWREARPSAGCRASCACALRPSC